MDAVSKIVRYFRERRNVSEEKQQQTVAIYEGIRVISILHRWMGLCYLHNMVRGDYKRVTNRLCSWLTAWNLFLCAFICVMACFQVTEVWFCFSVQATDRFTRLIVLIMLITTVICGFTTGATALVKSQALAEFIRESSETEKELQLPARSVCRIQTFAKWVIALTVLFGCVDGISVFVTELTSRGTYWKAFVRPALALVIRLCSLAHMQLLLLYCESLKVYFAHICKSLTAIRSSVCEQEKCPATENLIKLCGDYIRVCKLLPKVDALLSPVLLVHYCGSFFICCCCIYLLAKGHEYDNRYVEIWTNFFCGLTLMVLPSVVGGWMTYEAKRIPSCLSMFFISAHRACARNEVENFCQVAQNQELRISASGYFSLNLSSVVKILGTLATYGMLLIESKDFFTETAGSSNKTQAE